MPIHKFSNDHAQKVIAVANRSSIRLVSALFSKGFGNAAKLSLELVFQNTSFSPLCLDFSSASTYKDLKSEGLFFYNRNGAIFSVPANCKEIKLSVIEKFSFDYEFVLNYDFYPTIS